MIVGGTSKGRKTMALIDLAVSVATGTPWWGFRTKLGPVCYINFEIQDPFFWYRVGQICEAKGITIPKDMFYAWNLRGKADALENIREKIVVMLKRKPFVLDIIDPIYKALGDKDENKAGDVASMLNQLEKIAVETDSAIAFGAHYSKGNQAMKDSMDRIGGSGVFSRDPDSILTMTANEEEECFTVDCILRNFPPLSPFVVKWQWPLFTRDYEVDPSNLKRPRGSKSQFAAKYTKEMVLERVAIQAGINTVALRNLLGEQTGMSKPTFYRLKQELESDGAIIEKEGEIWKVLTP
jgi:hypothetical protein